MPKGYVVHHRNRDKADNRIENLQLMTNEEHRAWHNQHDKVSYRCDYCGKEIQKSLAGSAGKLHFCDGHCWGRYITENKIYPEEQTCVICGKIFLAHKYSKTKTCSPEYKNKLISQTKRNKRQS
ncbi:MAG: HNH endonuclease [Selenomonadaceae bacterium]|nr:HNH endonuclease [Selenomonadaceae bacterium]